MPREYYLVAVDRPRDVNKLEMEIYIQDSVNSCIGMLHPDEPMFHMPRTCLAKRVTTKRVERLLESGELA